MIKVCSEHVFLPIKKFSKFSLLSLLFLVGCANTSNINKIDVLAVDDAEILIMPMDVELSVLTAIGALEPNAEWTESASGFIEKAIIEKMSSFGYESEVYVSSETDPGSDLIQLEKLHEAVGMSVLMHGVKPTALPLPSKKGEFDWTLGEKAKALKEVTDSDYALFVFFRDSYSSGGRVAMQVGMALLGVGIPGGQQLGFASLVDLNTGEIVWFNRLVSGSGDARKEEPAAKTVNNLLASFPSGQ